MISNITPHIISSFTEQHNLAGLFVVTRVDLNSLQKRVEEQKQIVDTYLCQQEKSQYEGYKYPKRRYEWLGGRIAVKHAAINFRTPETTVSLEKKIWHNLQVCQKSDKQPYLYSPSPAGDNLPHISISHSHGVALGMAASYRCGIDIQTITAAVERVQNRFVTEQEQKLLYDFAAASSDKARDCLTLLWSAKEAIKKASHIQPLPGFLEIALHSIQKEDGYRFHLVFRRDKNKMESRHNVFATRYNSSILAITLNKEASSCST
jgi:4'-phosphopantetheinyl transferase EntD